MSMLARKVAEREKGEAPLSIGTSMALESLGGFGEFVSDSPPIYRYDEIWVNLRTLFRNCYNAVDRSMRGDLQATDLIDALVDDVRVLVSTIELKSHGKMKPVLYWSSFKSFKASFPRGKWKELTTSPQIVENALEQATLKMLLNEHRETLDVEIKDFDVRITSKGTRVVMLTHYPVDLLWRKQFTQLTLLESHTGSFKTRPEWYTKLTGGRRYNRIPFNRMTMQIFGDGNLLFASMSSKIKNRVLEIAEKDGWTPVTTDEKIRYSINKLHDPIEKTFFLELLSK